MAKKDELSPEQSSELTPIKSKQSVAPPIEIDNSDGFDTSGSAGRPAKKGWFGGMGSFITPVISAGLAVVVTLLISNYTYVSKTDDKKNISGIVTTIGKIQTDDKNAVATINALNTRLQLDEAAIEKLKTDLAALKK